MTDPLTYEQAKKDFDAATDTMRLEVQRLLKSRDLARRCQNNVEAERDEARAELEQLRIDGALKTGEAFRLGEKAILSAGEENEKLRAEVERLKSWMSEAIDDLRARVYPEDIAKMLTRALDGKHASSADALRIRVQTAEEALREAKRVLLALRVEGFVPSRESLDATISTINTALPSAGSGSGEGKSVVSRDAQCRQLEVVWAELAKQAKELCSTGTYTEAAKWAQKVIGKLDAIE